MIERTPSTPTRRRTRLGRAALAGLAVSSLLLATAPAASADPAAAAAAPVTAQRLAPTTRTATATVHFASGSAYLTNYSQRILIRFLRTLPAGATVVSTKIVGYVQARTAYDNGRALGTKRAAEVRTHLRALGLTGRIDLAAGGIAGTDALSRRAVVTVTYRLAQPQSIMFHDIEAMTVGDSDQPLTAAASSGLRVVLRSTSTDVCTVVGTADAPMLHAVAPGDCSVVATQPGNAVFGAAAPVTRTATIDPVHINPPAPASYVVTFDAGEGVTVPDPTTWTEGDDALVLPTPARDGYTFDGWFTAVEQGELVGLAGAEYTPVADLTLYGRWTAIPATFEVTYDAASGVVDPASVQFTEGDDALVLPTPTREGYTFDGWFTAAEQGELVGLAGAEYTPAADITLHAQWTAVSTSHVVTFHANYDGGPAATTQESEDAAALTANPFQGPGNELTFAGWATEPGGAVVYADGATYDFAADEDLYAVWGFQVLVVAGFAPQQEAVDVTYCGRADGLCADDVEHLVVPADQWITTIVVFPNQQAGGVLDGFEVKTSLPWGWVGTCGVITINGTQNRDYNGVGPVWYDVQSSGHIHLDGA